MAKGHKRVARRKPAPPKKASGRVTARTGAKSTKLANGKRERSGSVAILAMGYSIASYFNDVMRAGSPHRVADTIIGINTAAIACHVDLAIIMDELTRYDTPESRAAEPQIADTVDWAKTATIPIVTANPDPRFPTAQHFPLARVVDELRSTWLSNSVAYAVAYANVVLRAKTIRMYGADFYFRERPGEEQPRGWEAGMSCVVHHLTMFHDDGGEIRVARDSVLMDMGLPNKDQYYGYTEQPHLMMHRGKPTALFNQEAVAARQKAFDKARRAAAKGAMP